MSIRIAIIGLGMGKNHLKAFQKNPEVQVAAVCDVSAEMAKQTAERFCVEKSYTSYEEMIKKENLDAVSIATPNKYHAPIALYALNKGLHVLCEKPMAMTVAEAEQMRKTAEKAGKNLMINFSYRFSEMSFALKEQVDAGVLGDIYFGETFWHRRLGIPGLGGWFGQKELAGGGPLIDLGVHRLDLALWLMGYPEPARVSGSSYDRIAAGKAYAEGKKFDVEDMACGIVHFANGATLIVEASWALNIREDELMETRLCGTKGGLVQRNVDGAYRFEAEIYTSEGSALYTKKLDRTALSVPESYDEFITSIMENRPPVGTAEEGVKVMKILEGIYKSAATGAEVRY